MTKNSPKKDEAKHLKTLMRHIALVRDACEVIADKLIEEGEFVFAKKLIANSLIHDNSKFYGVEWDHLNSEEKEWKKIAIQHHIVINPHHPQYWGGIENMPRIYIAELVADWHARGQEFGTSLSVWIKDVDTDRFKFTLKGKVYKEIKYFSDILLESSF